MLVTVPYFVLCRGSGHSVIVITWAKSRVFHMLDKCSTLSHRPSPIDTVLTLVVV